MAARPSSGHSQEGGMSAEHHMHCVTADGRASGSRADNSQLHSLFGSEALTKAEKSTHLAVRLRYRYIEDRQETVTVNSGHGAATTLNCAREEHFCWTCSRNKSYHLQHQF